MISRKPFVVISPIPVNYSLPVPVEPNVDSKNKVESANAFGVKLNDKAELNPIKRTSGRAKIKILLNPT